MTRKEAKDILLKFVEENKYKSDWNGFLAGAISTYLEPIDEEKLDELAKQCTPKMMIDEGDGVEFQWGFIVGYRKAIEE